DSSRHPFTPHPDCPLCSRRTGDEPEAARLKLRSRRAARPGSLRGGETPPDPTWLRARLFDEQCGLVRRLYDFRRSYLLPMTFAAVPVDDDMGRAETGVGRTGRADTSAAVAMLEALER